MIEFKFKLKYFLDMSFKWLLETDKEHFQVVAIKDHSSAEQPWVYEEV